MRLLRSGDPQIEARAAPRSLLSDEGALVERARAGERPAFETLVRRYADRLYAVVSRFVASAEEAEDVTQEAFLRAWRSMDRFEGRSEFFTWLYRIGINEAKRRARRQPTAGQVISLDERPIDPTDLGEAPEPRAELRDALERAIRQLPPDLRAPLILRDIEGLSTHEAAAVMQLREAALKSRLHRARLAVREAVHDYLEDPVR